MRATGPPGVRLLPVKKPSNPDTISEDRCKSRILRDSTSLVTPFAFASGQYNPAP